MLVETQRLCAATLALLSVLGLPVLTLLQFPALGAAMQESFIMSQEKINFVEGITLHFARFTTINQTKPNMSKTNFPKLNVKLAVCTIHSSLWLQNLEIIEDVGM